MLILSLLLLVESCWWSTLISRINTMNTKFEGVVAFRIGTLIPIQSTQWTELERMHAVRYLKDQYGDDIGFYLQCSGSPGGKSWKNTLCTPYAAGIATIGNEWKVIAHELGHIVGAPHCNPLHNCTCGIMSYCGVTQGVQEFDPVHIQQMIDYIPTTGAGSIDSTCGTFENDYCLYDHCIKLV